MMAAILRAVAVLVVAAAIVDPAVRIARSQPLPVDIVANASRVDPTGADAQRVRDQLAARLDGDVQITKVDPAAIVLVGGASPATSYPDGVAVSTVSMEPTDPSVRIRGVRASEAIVPGQRAILSVELEGRDVSGRTSTVVLERDGLEVARASHAWTKATGTAALTLAHTPTASGLVPLRVRLLSDGESGPRREDVADVAVRVVTQPLRVLAWEPRPSWALTFVRRALEANPAFAVSAFVRSSRGLATRTGTPPSALSASGLARFDAVLVGAPEELTVRDVEALDAFARVRGGAIVLLPDRLPAGPYRALLSVPKFDEILVQSPVPIDAGDGLRLAGSEFALPAADTRGHAIASISHGRGSRAAIISWTRGEGTVVLSGALDAWRYRGAPHDDVTFERFWEGLVAGLALASPPPLSVAAEPALAAPGDPIVIRARYRPTEWTAGTDRWPAVSAAVIAENGVEVPIRLWPSDTTGEYRAQIEAPAEGRYDVRAIGRSGLGADTPLVVSSSARTATPREVPAFVPSVTGGLAVARDDTRALESHLRALTRPVHVTEIHVLRSPWVIAVLAALLGGEWTLRRRNGLP